MIRSSKNFIRLFVSCVLVVGASQMSFASSIRAVIWDLDGTLVDSMSSVVDAYNAGIQKFLGHAVSREVLAQHWDADEFKIFLALLGPKNAPEALQLFHKKILQSPGLVENFPKMPRVLDQLSEKGYRLAVFTGRDRMTTRTILKRLDLEKYFEVVIVGEDLKRRKPDPDGVNQALAQLNKKHPDLQLTPANAVMLGDLPMDILAAKSAGVKSVGCLWNGMPFRSLLEVAQPDVLIQSPEQILPWLETI